jgi:hypothetical protein
MGDEQQEKKQDPRDIQDFLQRLSRDKHAFGAHLGMRVEHDFSELEKHERQQTAKKLRKPQM